MPCQIAQTVHKNQTKKTAYKKCIFNDKKYPQLKTSINRIDELKNKKFKIIKTKRNSRNILENEDMLDHNDYTYRKVFFYFFQLLIDLLIKLSFKFRIISLPLGTQLTLMNVFKNHC